ncbi:MAG: AraC family transcriptional regulator [Lachnospiraceae bacterium]|nr:AraC family transcriptional regulator [Lachnospiraceae bacterium]
MNFSKQFSHSLTSQYVSETGKSITDFLPPSLSYSAEAVEHIIYLKAAGNFHLPAGSKYSQKNFHSYLLLYNASGSAKLTLKEHPYTFEEHQLCLVDCRNNYSLSCSTACEFLALFFDGYPVLYYYDLFQTRSQPVITLPKNSPLPQILINLSGQNFIHTELNNAKLLTDLLTNLIIFCDTHSEDINLPGWLVQLREHLNNNYEEHFSLDELSELVNINKYQICRDFKKHLKATPLQYVNHLRIEQAKVLLRTTSDQIGEICYQVGFENANHFIQLFKREVGVTPAYYRKNGV